MSPTEVSDALAQAGILTPEQHTKIVEFERQRPFSVHYELRTVLYAGVTLLSLGLGLLVYNNFDRIGHGALLAAVAAACAGSFAFAWRNRPPWSTGPTPNRSTFGDYALLLACLLFLTLEGYAQYAYNVFGNRYGLVTLLPALVFWPLAYRFDHRGVLGIALAALIAWVGVTVRPLQFYLKTNFFDQRTVLSAVALGVVLIGVALALNRRRVKPHFTDTYLTIGGNLLLTALLGGLFNFAGLRLGFALGLAGVCFGFDCYARRNRSFLFLLMSTVYGYIGATYLVFHYVLRHGWADTFWYFLYFVLTGIGLTTYLVRQSGNRLPTSDEQLPSV